MDEPNNKLKALVVKLCAEQSFIHHGWFVKYHLEIIEKIVSELLVIYKEADKDLTRSMVWIHDLAKIKGLDVDVPSKEISELMTEAGFSDGYINKTIEYLSIFEKKMEIDLSLAPIEVRIVSSADGVSHMVGPFMSIFFYENPTKSIEDITQGNINKSKKDWERKIVLPEVKKAFEGRYNFTLESNGDIPDRFLI